MGIVLARGREWLSNDAPIDKRDCVAKLRFLAKTGEVIREHQISRQCKLKIELLFRNMSNPKQ